ncbi:Glucosamine-phosphate N-acetyltransferase-like protein, partial [Coemansia sp. 'formosensis']
MVSSNSLFDSSLLGASAQSSMPPNHIIRPLELTDYRKSYIECLANLTVVGDVTEQMFADSFEDMQRAGCYFVVVIEDLESTKI